MKNIICVKCGEELQEKVCRGCGGKGTIGIWFWKRICRRCNGIGKTINCSYKYSYSHSNAKETKCPNCDKNAWFLPCQKCHGWGNIQKRNVFKLQRQWTKEELSINPFRSYYQQLPTTDKITVKNYKCEQCEGNGGYIFCIHCNKEYFII